MTVLRGRTARGRSPLPSREELLRYIEDSPAEVTRREIVRAFNLKGDDRTQLKRMLRELQAEGRLERGRRRRMRPSGRLPSVAVLEIMSIDEDGDLWARPLPRPGEEAEEAAVIRIPADSLGRFAPAVADRMLTRVIPDGDGRYEGRILKLLPHSPDRVLGVLEAAGDGLRLRPIDRKAQAEYRIAEDEAAGAEVGDLAFAEVLPGRRIGLARARIVERLGSEDDPRAISLVAAFAHGLPIAFDPEALGEAHKAEPVALGARTDLRDLDLVTIDGPDARDFDDAVWAAADDDPANPGGFQVVVAIADVAHYVRPGSALDREAERRGNSVYFPDRAIPMLPEALSNDLCSLRPGEDRACLAVRMTFDAEGNKVRHRFVRGLMRSRARLTYEQVQAAFEGREDASTAALVDPVIRPLYGAYRALEGERRRRGTIDLDIPEFQVVLDDAGAPAAVRRRDRLDSHRLIEEFMIAANVAAAETLESRGMACMYRVHDRPDPVKVEALATFLDALGVPCKAHMLRRPPDFARLLERLEGHELLPMVSGFVLRAQSQAAYSPENLGHFGLHLRRYAHFTSPIRRYSDLLVHRALIRALKLGEGGLEDGVDTFHELGAHISRTERRAMEAERLALSRFISLFMAERVGSVFGGRVSGVQPFGLFVSLDDTGADGLVPVASLGLDYFDFDPHHHALIGRRSGTAFGLGDAVQVELAEVDLATGQLAFRLVEHEPGAAARHALELHGRPRRRPKTTRRFRRR